MMKLLSRRSAHQSPEHFADALKARFEGKGFDRACQPERAHEIDASSDLGCGSPGNSEEAAALGE